MNEIIAVILAAIISWLNFVIVDTFFGLPEQPGVKGAKIVGESIKKRGGDLSGGFFQGNVLCSPDASAGTLIASMGVLLLGFQGGLIAALLVFIGNRLCADPGYAGTTGALTATVIISLTSLVGLTPQYYVVGMVIAIFTIQGLNHSYSSRLLGKIAKLFNRNTKLE
jgi:energy-converting hydrogenase A subunit B